MSLAKRQLGDKLFTRRAFSLSFFPLFYAEITWAQIVGSKSSDLGAIKTEVGAI